MIKPFEYINAKNIDEAIKETNGTFLAGGTDIVPLMKYEVKDVEKLIYLADIEKLHKIIITDDEVFIGAMVTLTQLCEHKDIADKYPALSFAARCVASPQIRNVGTIGGNIMQDRRCFYFNQSAVWRSSIEPCYKTGGNICHQAPTSPICKAIYYSDVATVLYTLDAQVMIYEEQGLTKKPIAEVLKKHSEINGTFSKENSLVVGFCLPNNGQVWSKFIKESVRDAIDFPTFNASIAILNNHVNLAVGAIADTPIKLIETEAFIEKHKQNLTAVKPEIEECVMKEIYAQAVLIREDTISIPVKKKAMNAILHLIDVLIENI